MSLTVVGGRYNDLIQTLRRNRIYFRRAGCAENAIRRAGRGAAVVVLADARTDKPVRLPMAAFRAAARKGVRLFVEFPAQLPGLAVGRPLDMKIERGVVASSAFAPGLKKWRILMIHGCRLVPVSVPASHIVMARVAGFDRAVYGLPKVTYPILFEHPDGNLLVATTKLSPFVAGRYAPTDAWQDIWNWVLNWLTGADVQLQWTPAVRPSHAARGRLPRDAERRALDRAVDWFYKARLFVHPSWLREADRRRLKWGQGAGPGPDLSWPSGDGSLGMLEGVSSGVHADGRQDYRYWLRNDCMGEAVMTLAFRAALAGNRRDARVAKNLQDYIYFNSMLAQGRRARPRSASYGLVMWSNMDTHNGIYYGDDNARSMMGSMAAAALLKTSRWNEALTKCLLANLRTTGPQGFRGNRLTDDDLQKKGWEYYWNTDRVNLAPHYECWLWACFLWAFERTGFQPFFDRAKTAIRLTMEAYPKRWRWTNGLQQERARMILPLAWLVRLEDVPQNRRWLRTVTRDLLRRQDACGAIAEEVGRTGTGAYGPPRSNEAYGTNEAPLIQSNGDPLADLLYTVNFAFPGLHEAAAATGEALYARAADRLADFVCRAQVKSESHPELDGGWFRAFEFKRWEYWASNADWAWGAWCIESGWTQTWLASVLAMRQMKTSLWDLTSSVGIRLPFERLRPVMLPDRACGPASDRRS